MLFSGSDLAEHGFLAMVRIDGTAVSVNCNFRVARHEETSKGNKKIHLMLLLLVWNE